MNTKTNSNNNNIHRLKIIDELHRTARKNFKRRRVILKGIDDLWQADLVEMGTYASINNNYRFILTIIDCFSKYTWAVPLKEKTGKAVTNGLESVLEQQERKHKNRNTVDNEPLPVLKQQLHHIPKNLQTDDGKEFYNKHFQKLIKEYQINHYSTYSIMKASIVERFNRTLKNWIWKEFSLNGTYRWIDILPNIIKKYNSTRHRTIKMEPNKVTTANEKHLLDTIYNHIKLRIRSTSNKFKIGDFVRISKYKHIFKKGYTPN